MIRTDKDGDQGREGVVVEKEEVIRFLNKGSARSNLKKKKDGGGAFCPMLLGKGSQLQFSLALAVTWDWSMGIEETNRMWKGFFGRRWVELMEQLLDVWSRGGRFVRVLYASPFLRFLLA